MTAKSRRDPPVGTRLARSDPAAAVIAFDGTGRIVLASNSQVLTSLEDDAPVGRHVNELCQTDARLREAVQRCLAGGDDDLITERDQQWWEIQARSLVDPHGHVSGGLLLIQASHTPPGGRWRLRARDRETAEDDAQERALHAGIARGELVLHYQPLVSVVDQAPQGVEALVRWQHRDRGLLPPLHFIPLAERSGLIHEVGAWVLGEALRHGAAERMSVAVNVSARQLVEGPLLEQLPELLQRTGCPPSALTIEVTETALTTDLTAATATLDRLKRLGVSLALDDFGTGYSSLLYLRHFPVDTLKIDRSFVAGLGTSAADTAIVASTISLAHSIGIQCVAEGVETVPQLELLRELGCELAQGYLFSPPVDSDELRRWLTSRPPVLTQAPVDRAAHADAVVTIMRMQAEGASLYTICAALNAAGSRTVKGTRWHPKSVATVIAKATYPDLDLT